MLFFSKWGVTNVAQYTGRLSTPTVIALQTGSQLGAFLHRLVIFTCDKTGQAPSEYRNMELLRRLLHCQRHRHYAFIDEHGRCQMLFSATNRPRGRQWIEVGEVRCEWIGRPLPHDAALGR